MAWPLAKIPQYGKYSRYVLCTYVCIRYRSNFCIESNINNAFINLVSRHRAPEYVSPIVVQQKPDKCILSTRSRSVIDIFLPTFVLYLTILHTEKKNVIRIVLAHLCYVLSPFPFTIWLYALTFFSNRGIVTQWAKLSNCKTFFD